MGIMDSRPGHMIVEDHKRANEFAEKGTLKHFLLKQGFFPNNESEAEKMLKDLINGKREAGTKYGYHIKVTKQNDMVYFHINSGQSYINIGMHETDASKLAEVLGAVTKLNYGTQSISVEKGGFSSQIDEFAE